MLVATLNEQRFAHLRILILHEFPAVGVASGEAVVARMEANALRAEGHQVELVDLGQLVGSGSSRNIRMIYNSAVGSHVRQVVSGFRPDIVHIHGVTPFSSGSLFESLRRVGVPHVQTLHNYRWLCIEGGFWRAGQRCDACTQGTRWHGVVNRCVRGSAIASIAVGAQQYVSRELVLPRSEAHFIAISDYVKSVYLKNGWPADRVHVKHNMLPEVEELQHWQPANRVLYVGRVSAAKGSAVLEALADRMPHVYFEVCGSAAPGEEATWDRLNAKRNVILHGTVDQRRMSEIAHICVAQIVPSQWPEPFGLAALEGMARGLPVIVSSLGGLPEVVGNAGTIVSGGTGPTQTDQYEQAISGYIDSPEMRIRASRAGTTQSSSFSAGVLVRRLEEIYLTAISSKTGTRSA